MIEDIVTKSTKLNTPLQSLNLVPNSVKLRELNIENFKALDHLVIKFPEPLMSKDPDIFVIGSENGIGKTSVLEACSLLFLAAISDLDKFLDRRFRETETDLFDLIIRAGANEATIMGKFEIGGEPHEVSLIIPREKEIRINRAGKKPTFFQNLLKISSSDIDTIIDNFSSTLFGLSAEPLIVPPFMYFHSYRKVQEGNPELGMMVNNNRIYRNRIRYREIPPISTFKLIVLRSLMSRGGLFERLEDFEVDDVLKQFNGLMQEFAGGKIEKLRPSSDNTLEFRVTPSKGGESFNFDGLSSGQKEIISTLFLIWYYMRPQPGIVLIDEPELHLNAQWHLQIIRYLHRLAPDNQYIIATHSEFIFDSVDERNRARLVSTKK